MSGQAAPEGSRVSWTALLRDLGVNAAAPYATYLILHGQGIGVVAALAAGAMFPVAAITLGFLLRKRVEALGFIVVAATAASIVGALFFTSPYLLLAKGSLVTGGVGTVFLLSLAARYPLVFHLVSSTGQDTAGHERYLALWRDLPSFRLLMRRLTLIWAIALYAEAGVRLALIKLLPIEVFLPVSEAMWIGFFAAMTVWSWRYGARRLQRARDE